MAKKIAEAVVPEIADEIFYAALLHEIGCVGPEDGHIESILESPGSPAFTYPAKGFAIIANLPGMSSASQYIRCHHEWIDGSGFPFGLACDMIPIGGQILVLAEAVILSGFLDGGQQMMERLKPLASLTGRAWTTNLWSNFLKSTQDAEYYRAIIDTSAITTLLQYIIANSSCPVQNNCEGIKSILEIAACLVDNKNPTLAGHSTRVARESLKLADYMRLDEYVQTAVYYAGLVHDFGKIIVPSHILNTPGRITEDQKRIVRSHAEKMLQVWCVTLTSEGLNNLAIQAFHDHERYDGGGYPDGLIGENIPLASRIIGVVDTYDVIIGNDYNYRLISPKGALSRIRQEAGNQFDPNIVDAFIAMKSSEENLCVV